MIPVKTDSVWLGISDCRQCSMRDVALFADLKAQDLSKIHAPIDDLEFAQGTELYLEGGNVQGIFSLRLGMVKLVRNTHDGRPRIVRVLRPGDVIGLEALAGACYDSDAVALTPVRVCRIPLDVIQQMVATSPRLYAQLMSKWQLTLKEAGDWLADLNFGSARQRVARLVLKMRNPDEQDVSMLFSREDMGAMLDLKFETVSREISRLVREEVIAPLDKQGRVYRVCLPERLLE